MARMEPTATHPTGGTAALEPPLGMTLALVARGYFPTEIASIRGVSVGAVVVDLHRAVEALDVATVREAIAAAAQRGLLT